VVFWPLRIRKGGSAGIPCTLGFAFPLTALHRKKQAMLQSKVHGCLSTRFTEAIKVRLPFNTLKEKYMLVLTASGC
jgi:hypothetical protein